MIIITAEETFVFKVNSWLASVAGACPGFFVRRYVQATATQADSW